MDFPPYNPLITYITGTRGIVGDFWPLSGGKIPLTELLKKDDQKSDQLDKLATLLELHFKDMQVGGWVDGWVGGWVGGLYLLSLPLLLTHPFMLTYPLI